MTAKPCRRFVLSGLLTAVFALSATCQTVAPLQNRWLTVSVRPQDGSFELHAEAVRDAVLAARVGAEVDHQWIWSTDYPSHQATASTFQGPLGPGHQIEILFSGAAGKPNLRCLLQMLDNRPSGNVQVKIENTRQQAISVQDIRVLDVISKPVVNLGGPEEMDRVLSDSYSEDRPPLHIVDLGKAHVYNGGDDLGADFADTHLAVGSQLIYNRQSGVSLLLAALTSDRWLTILRLKTDHASPDKPGISSYAVDSTGTTEILKKESLHDDPASDQVELSLPVAPAKEISSEQLAFSVSKDYHAQLESYGEAIRMLYNPRIPASAPWGWWSWTAYYFGLSQGTALSNAQWLSEHLKNLGYNYFHIDAGYAYDDGEYTTPNATLFPDGIGRLGHQVCQLGLNFAMWVAPFRVAERAWVYENHPEWLVHNAQGKPIQIGFIESSHDAIYVLDATHPGAQAYLRQTYQTLTREWGARYFKLDFMDDTAIEGYRYQPDVTGLEAQRIGLKVIRDAVGDNVLLDKDGSVMLNTVGLTELGRTSTDTGHSFSGDKEDATGIAARYYMNNNFYIADPDAFTVSEQLITDQTWHQSKKPISLDEAELSITLAAIAGGMFELGDDLPTLGAEPDRLNLVRNRDLLDMVRLRRAAKPLDLMTYADADEQPSSFFLQESKRQSMLVVFNWTEGNSSHKFTLSELGLAPNSAFHATDVFRKERAVSIEQGALRIDNQAPHSVRVIKIVDNSIPASAPQVNLQAPAEGQLATTMHFSAALAPEGVPGLAYHWDFGDGISAEGPVADHAYTRNGVYKISLQVEGLDGIVATKSSTITIQGSLKTTYDIENARRFQDLSK